MPRAFVSASKVNEKNSCWHEISFSMEDRVRVGFYFLSVQHRQDRKDRRVDRRRRRENAAPTVVCVYIPCAYGAYLHQQQDYHSTTTPFSLERCFHAGGSFALCSHPPSFFKNTDRGMDPLVCCVLCDAVEPHLRGT